jgi:hypothetical protein
MMQWERRDGEPGIAFRIIEHTRIAWFAVNGWTRVWLLRKERCACQSYLCPYTRGRGMHITPYQP